MPSEARKVLAIALAVVVGIGVIILAAMTLENVDANEIMVVQSPVSGELSWYTSAGIKWQGFGKVTFYPKRAIYEFTCSEYQANTGENDCTPNATDTRIGIRFNDGGHGKIDGSIQYDMPMDEKNLTDLHTRFGSRESIQKQLVETTVNKSIYMTGPVMSSKESYADRRNDLIRYVEDQVENGVYQTVTSDVKEKDPLSGIEKTVKIVQIAMEGGIPKRQEEGQLTKFGIKPFNFSIKHLPYDKVVEDQIQQQQQLTMQVQTAMAEAKQAEQRAITVAKEGEANAAKAKWEQEVVKAKEVTAAEQRLSVAELDRKTAEQRKQEQILLGEGEARRRQLVMTADGALEMKLATYKEVQKMWADAVKGYAGNWVPQFVMGGGGSNTSGSGANQLIELLSAKTARDLSLDMSVPKK